MMGSQPTDGLVMNDPSGYQQPLYLTGPPEHSMGISVRYVLITDGDERFVYVIKQALKTVGHWSDAFAVPLHALFSGTQQISNSECKR
jgi:hypothetical protein